jgi:iron(III) transport system permease protein
LSALPLAYLAIRTLGVDADALLLLLRPRTFEILFASLALATGTVIGAVALGLPLAWLTTRTDLPGRRLWTVLAVVPLAIPSYVTAFAIVAALGPRGAVSELLVTFGLASLPSIYGFGGAVLVMTLATYPYVLLATRGALIRLDPALDEAARALGDGPFTVARRVTLPLLLPAIAAGALLAALYALSDFGAVAILQFDSFARAIYIQYRASFDRSLAAVLALALVFVTLILARVESHVRGRPGSTAVESRRERRPVALGRWRWPALAFCAAVSVIAVVIPAATITVWFARGFVQGETLGLTMSIAGNSLIAGVLAALVVAALALPVAYLVLRHPGRLASAIEGVLYSAYAVPGIVVALAAVFFVVNVAPIVYQSLLVLVLAYAVRFLPVAVGPTRASVALVGPRLVEAARSLGDSPRRAFWLVTLPLVRPGVIAGMALVFLVTVKELPLTLLLAPTGYETLATAVWGATTEGFYARAAAPAAVLMLLSALTVGILFRADDSGR